MNVKIVVVGQVGGRLREVFKKISNLHAKNAFSLTLIVGNLFADPASSSDQNADIESLLNGQIEVPIPTYFTLGSAALPLNVVERIKSSNGELAENLYFMDKRTTIKTSEGARIVVLGGSLDSSSDLHNDKFSPKFNEFDAKALRGANNADILITSEWPADIQRGSKVTMHSNQTDINGRACIAELCSALKPRYHFSTSPNTFYEREPFFHMRPPDQTADGFSITRFISLASYGNTSKQKWIYAFTLDTSTTTLPLNLPTGTTASPFAATTTTNKRTAHPAGFTRFSTETHSTHNHSNKRRRHHTAMPPPTPATCFFCLSNPALPTHLITSISTNTYLTTAKGPLPTRTTNPALPFPAHILLIPIAHTPTLAALADPPAAAATAAELRRYRTALNRMLAAHSTAAPTTTAGTAAAAAPEPLGSVAWDIRRAAGVHAHTQWLPLPAALVVRGLAEAAFKAQAELDGYAALRVVQGEGSDGETEGNEADEGNEGDVLHVYLWTPPAAETKEVEDGDESKEVRTEEMGSTRHLVLPLPAPSADPAALRFNLQYPRLVLAKLLRLEARVNWRDCEQSVEEETEDAEAFREAFKPWDFSLVE